MKAQSKKFVAAISVAAIAGSLFVPASPAFSQSENAASVAKDFQCVGFVPTESGGFGPGLFSTLKTHSVVTSSDNTSLICHFDIPEGQEPDSATQASGFGCGTFLGGTTDTKMVATPGGKAVLICKINGSAD